MTYQVLLVDDESIDLEWMRRRISSRFNRLEVAAAVNSGFKALEVLQEQPIDILLSDIRMPIMSGLELASQARRLRPDIKIAFISGHEDFSYAREAIRIHASAYMLKPVPDRELVDILEEMARKLDRERGLKAADNEWIDPVMMEKTPNIDATVELLYEALRTYQLVRVDELLEEIFAEVRQLKSKAAIIHFILYFVSRLQMKCQKMGEDLYAIMGWEPEYFNVLVQLDTVHEMNSWLRRKMFELSERLYMKDQKKNRRIITEIIDYITEQIENKLTLKEVAERFEFSPNYLGFLFREETGECFSDYLIRVKLEHACQLLQDPCYRVYEIAERAGYKNIIYFNRQFKKVIGMTPGEYRKSKKV